MTPGGMLSSVPSISASSPVRPLTSASLYQQRKDQIACRGIEKNAFPGTPERGLAQEAASAQARARPVRKTRAQSRKDRHHIGPRRVQRSPGRMLASYPALS